MDETPNVQPKKRSKIRLYKPRKKKYIDEDAAIKFLQAQYDTIKEEEIKTFRDFPLSQKTLKGLKDNNYNTPTDIQRQAIGCALQGKDILGAAKTGSGKTLAFLIPILERLFCKKWTRLDGVGALVISPTRELAYQTYETLRKVGYLHNFSASLIIGGQNLKYEKKRMDQINILICTPGRLLQHLDENPLFNCDNLQILVLDEADRCLDMGFEKTMNAIIEFLPSDRQTLLYSATQTKSVKDLARLSLSFPSYIAPHEQALTATPDMLQQNYVVHDAEEKLGILWAFIKNHLKHKVLVFMSTCKQVKFVYNLFTKLKPNIHLLALYGSLHQERRVRIYEDFCRKSNVVLFATDLASRGLDFPQVNWVIQMDCPEDVDTYIHRVGRTARGVCGKGDSLLILTPHEENFVEDLKKKKLPINKIFIDSSKVNVPQTKIMSLISENVDLKLDAEKAVLSYFKSIYIMKNKEIFNVQNINGEALAKSYGLNYLPKNKFLEYILNKKVNTKINKENHLRENCQINQNEQNDNRKIENGIEHDSMDTQENDDTESAQNITELNNKDHNVNDNMKETVHNEVIKQAPMFVFSTNESYKCIHSPERHLSDLLDFTDSMSIESKPFTKIRSVQENTSVKFSEEYDKNSLYQDSEVNFSLKDIILKRSLEDKSDKEVFNEKLKSIRREKKRKIKNKPKEVEQEQDVFDSQTESEGEDMFSDSNHYSSSQEEFTMEREKKRKMKKKPKEVEQEEDVFDSQTESEGEDMASDSKHYSSSQDEFTMERIGESSDDEENISFDEES